MIEVNFVAPPEVIKKLSARFALRHKNGATGYFCDLTQNEFWNITRSLVNSGYRIDITPGDSIRLMAKREDM